MVAACPANQAPDVSIASALGSLLHVHRSIQTSYWRLHALVRLAPLFERFGLSRDRLAREIRELWPRVRTSARILEPDRRTSSERFIALVDAIWEAGGRSRLAEAERAFAHLTKHHRSIGAAHLARLELRFRSVDAALARVRGIREQGRRSGALLVVVRGAVALGRLDVARETADLISATMMRERAWLSIAEALVERAADREAMKVLSRVTLPGLQAERFWLYLLIRRRGKRTDLRYRRFVPDAMVRASVEEPRWVRVGRARSSVRARVDLIGAVFYLGLRRRFADDLFNEMAANLVERSVETSTERRDLVELLDTDPDPLEAIHVLGRFCPRGLTDALLAEYIEQRALRLPTSVPDAWSDGIVGAAPRSADVRSIDRALFDEGVALSHAARQRRRVLIAISQHCLRSALLEPDTWSRAVIDARLRTLVHLGGELACGAIAKPLATLPVANTFASSAIEALARLDARVAASVVFARAAELRAGGTDIERSLMIIETHQGVPCGFTGAYAAAARRVGDEFVGAVAAQWARRYGDIVPVLVLRSIVSAKHTPSTPSDLIEELAGLPTWLASERHLDIPRRLASEQGMLERLLVACPPRVTDGRRRWGVERWREYIRYVSSDRDVAIDEPIVMRCAQLLGCSSSRLATGDLVSLGLDPVRELVVTGERFRVRLLDKRRDFLTYVRFGDVPVRTCYRSDQSMWGTTQSYTIDAWRDPLSMCFHVEQQLGDCWKPIGFSFGGLVDLGRRAGAALSGLYMQRNIAEVRVAIISAIGEMLEQIGVRDLGITVRYQSNGALPTDYAEADVNMTRLHAIAYRGQPAAYAFDDISRSLNRPVRVSHLYWRRRRE